MQSIMNSSIVTVLFLGQIEEHEKEYWYSELKSLGIRPNNNSKMDKEEINSSNNGNNESNQLCNSIEELQSLTDNIKQVYYQDYMTAYGEREVGKFHFDYLI